MVTTEWVRRLPLFSGLPESSLAALAGLVRHRRLPARRPLFYEGDPVTALYYIDQGRVRISVVDEEGEESTINVLGDGEFFPHTGLLLGGAYPATATTLVETDLAYILRDDLVALVRRDPDLAFHLLLEMGKRVQILQARVRELLRRDLRARVLCVLLRLATMRRGSAPQAAPDTDAELDVPLTHEELAHLAGGARESVSRILADLRREGIVLRAGYRRVVVRPGLLTRALARSGGCPLLPAAPPSPAGPEADALWARPPGRDEG